MKRILILIVLISCVSQVKKIFLPNPDLFEMRLIGMFPERMETPTFNCKENGKGIPLTFNYPDTKEYWWSFITIRKYYICKYENRQSAVYKFTAQLFERLGDVDRQIANYKSGTGIYYCLIKVRKESEFEIDKAIKKEISSEERLIEHWFKEYLKDKELCFDSPWRTLYKTVEANQKTIEYDKSKHNPYCGFYSSFREVFCGTECSEKPKDSDPILIKPEVGSNGSYIHWTEYLCKDIYGVISRPN